MKKAKRFAALALSTLMAAGLFAGCGAPASGSAPASGTGAVSSSQQESALVEVSVAIWGADDGLADPNDPILKRIEEETGVRLVPQNVTWDTRVRRFSCGRPTDSFRISSRAILWHSHSMGTGSSRA